MARMDAAVAALIEQIKVSIEDSLYATLSINPETGESSWPREAIEKAIADSISTIGGGSFEVGKSYQPTYAQLVDHHREQLALARDSIKYAAEDAPDEWANALERYNFEYLAFMSALKGLHKHGREQLVESMMLGEIKIQPSVPVEVIKISFVQGKEADQEESCEQ